MIRIRPTQPGDKTLAELIAADPRLATPLAVVLASVGSQS